MNIISNEIHDFEFINAIENSLAIGSWEFNLKTNTLKWSTVTKKIHEVPDDYKPDVETGLNFYKEGLHRERITSIFSNAILTNTSFDDEFIIITAKGKEKWVRSIGYPVFENDTCVLVKGVFQDITEKTQKNIEISYKESLFRSIFENSITGMAIVSLEGKWLKVNNSICKIFGYSEAELLDLNFIELTHNDDKHIGLEEIKLMIEGKLDNFQVDKRYINKNGNIIHCQLSTTIVRDLDNEPVHFVANINDITKSKLAKQKIKNLLAISSKQNERLLNFAHIVSHNLRSHAGNLDMLIGLKKEDYPDAVDNEYFPHIEKAVKNLNETIANLNDVAIHNIVEVENLEPLNLLEYVNNAISNIKALHVVKKAKIKIDINKTIKVKGIPAYLDSIIINLLTNAIKYKNPDEDPKIKLIASKDDKNIILEVIDNGIGIDLKKHGEKLFGMYNVFHHNKDSRGLGLFITKNQIEAIGGKIEVKSKVGKGTTFRLFFKKTNYA
ncbi:PAS domain S-box protein [Lacinutrix sp. MedPE-SW]|uniref:sensor histidine kinase n=1 Tax=Lacinutrix sp. MedPE-SW TaxID=1860087 RepID=UPI0025BE32AF|nr:sensor histidine kinase [Lacinutrix sp. MedPE-SW]